MNRQFENLQTIRTIQGRLRTSATNISYSSIRESILDVIATTFNVIKRTDDEIIIKADRKNKYEDILKKVNMVVDEFKHDNPEIDFGLVCQCMKNTNMLVIRFRRKM